MKIRLLLISIFIILFWECASIKAPPGGPVDETPPEILSVVPPSGTVNLMERAITIEFSEYMDEASFKNNITVFPRFEEPLKHKFKGSKIVLKLPARLDSNKTYIIQLNRNIKDEHSVPLSQSKQLAYSISDKINRGVIRGKVYGKNQAVVHLWKIKDSSKDSLFASIPDYLTDVDNNGNYSFEYLAAGQYKILAVDKSSADLPLSVESTNYGMHWQDALALTEDDTISNINMRMWKEPEKLKLVRGEWSTYNWGNIYFNNDLPDSFSVFMKLVQNDNVLDYEYYIGAPDKDNLIVQVPDSLSSEPIILTIDSLFTEEELLIDSAEVKIQISQDADTSNLQIISPQSGQTIIPNNFEGDSINLIFSKPTELLVDSKLTPKLFRSDSFEIAIAFKKINPMYYIITLVEEWQQNEKYKLQFNRDNIVTEFGKGLKDSLQIINLSTTKSMGYGGVIGELTDGIYNDIVTELFSVKNPSLSRVANVNSQSQFEFKMIPEGDYSLRFFKDSNKDMKYNFGNAYQSQPSEWFYFYPDTFEVRANWDTELNPIELPEAN